MSRSALLLPVVAASAVLPGCDSHAHYDHAVQYVNSTRAVLIESGRCGSETDCSRKELIYFESGGLKIGSISTGGVHINVYREEDPLLVRRLTAEFNTLKARIGGPSVTLSVYKSAHLEPPVKLQEVVVK